MSEQPFVNIAASVPAMAERRPHALAVVYPQGRDRHGRVSYTHFTFRQLHEESDAIAHGLEAVGIRRGVRTVLMVKPSLEFFALTFALFKVAAVPILIDPGMGIRNLGQCLSEAEPEAFIGIPKAQVARALLGWGRRTIRTRVTVGTRLIGGGYTLDQVRRLGLAKGAYPLARTSADETAAILFTSGSTGMPKGVVYPHAVFAAQVEILRDLFHIEAGEIDLITFPLFALFAPALGMTAVIPDMDATRPAQVDPRKIIEAIDNFGVNNLFGSPALLNRVGRYAAEHKLSFPSLKRVLSAGAPVSSPILERFAGLLSPGVQVFTPYGATESLPVCSIGSDEILKQTRHLTDAGAGVCVGRPVAPMKVAIIRISDDPIPTWSDDLLVPAAEIGEIVVQGPIVTRAYYRRPESTALAKIADPPRGGFYHRLGDLGYLDEHGRVWFCGRKSQRVITPNGTLFTIPCEAVFNTHPQVFRTALVGVSTNGTTRPVLCVELEKGCETVDRESLKRELLALGVVHAHTRGITTILFHPLFPVDTRHNAKIFREKLAVWAARKTTMKALVTGGGGFLGKAIVERLRRRGDSVRSFSRGDYPELRELGVEVVRGELADAAAVQSAAMGCDIVFHVAAKAGIWGPYQDYYQTNVVGTQHVLQACRVHAIRRLVFTSSPSVVFNGRDMEGVDESVPYPEHFETAYPQTKALAEQLVLKANGVDLATVALRPHLIWGPGDNHLVPRILERGRSGKLRRIGDRPNRVDCVYIDNAADAHLLAADRLSPGSPIAGKAYFISQGEPMPLWDLVNRILQAGGIPPVTRTISPRLAYGVGWLFEHVYRLFHIQSEPRMTRFLARELSTAHWFKIDAARSELGYEPAVSIEEGMRRLEVSLRQARTG